jgi:DNA polymerase-3 subunit beta
VEFSVLRSDFIEYLSKIVNLAKEYKGPKQMLRNLLLDLDEERLKMVSSNEESEMIISVPSNLISVTSTGSVAVPAASIFDICKFDLSKLNKGAEDRIYFSLDESSNRMTIKRINNSYEVNCFNSSLYPNRIQVSTKDGFDITEGELLDMLNSTTYAMGVEDNRVFLNGMNVRVDGKNIEFLSSDAHRLSYYKYMLLDAEDDAKEEKSKASAIIARNGIMSLKKLISGSSNTVSVSFGKSYAQFDTEKFSFVTKLIDGTCLDPVNCFPDEKSFLASMKIDREMLIAAVRSITVICHSSEFSKILMNFEDDKITLSSTNVNHEHASVTVPVENFNGNPSKITINHKYLLDVLECVPCKYINFSYSKVSALLTPVESSNFCEEKFLIMLVKM